MRNRKRNDEAASAASIGLIVALLVFSSGFYFLTATVREPQTSTVLIAEEKNFHTVAESLSAALLNSGEGWYSGAACTSAQRANTAALAPEQMGTLATSRFGLGEELCNKYGASAQGVNNVSFTKLANIYEAQTDADPSNGRVDYQEARVSLGLDDKGLDFHLRTWLIPSSVQEIIATGFKDQYLRPVYVGHYVEPTPRSVTHTAGFVNNADNLVLYVRVTNTGSQSTIFGVEYQLPLDRGTMEFTLHTPLLTTGQSHNVTVTIRKTSDWTWDSSAVALYTISDPYDSLNGGTINLAGVSMTYASQRNTQVVWASDYYRVLSGATVSAPTNYASYDGTGRTTTWTDWTQRIYGPPLGLVVSTNVLPNIDDGVVSATLASQGTFTAKLQNDLLLSTWNQDTINVVAAAPSAFQGGQGSHGPSVAVAVEANMLATLAEQFDPYVYSATYNSVSVPYLAGGDIYPDVRDVLNDDFVDLLVDASGNPSLAEVSTVIVGSDVDHHAMNDPGGRDALADWVNAAPWSSWAATPRACSGSGTSTMDPTSASRAPSPRPTDRTPSSTCPTTWTTSPTTRTSSWTSAAATRPSSRSSSATRTTRPSWR
jgi:hypothetical protein